jgi:serine/threonine-protein kinase HipA
VTEYRTVDVIDDQLGTPAGRLSVSRSRGAERYRFIYTEEFLGHRHSYDLDPTLPRSGAPLTVATLFGAFTDAAPDRWGRTLIARGRIGHVFESDYLLDVYDPLRQGALRFRENGRWLNDTGTVPRTVDLPPLRALARDVVAGDPKRVHLAAKELLEVGTSALGGAHPKVSVLGDDGTLYICKLAMEPADSHHLRNEYATLLIMREVGLHAPGPPLLLGDDGAETALLIPRFDRSTSGRIAYASCKTLLGAGEGERADYLDIAGIAEECGASPDELSELFKRVALGAVIHNTDDHLRNHGFIREAGRWRLSPVFDVNPNIDRAKLHETSLDGRSDIEGMLAALPTAAVAMGVDPDDATEFLDHIDSAVASSPLLDEDVKIMAHELCAAASQKFIR